MVVKMQYYDKRTGYIETFHASDMFLAQLYKLQKRYGVYNKRPPVSPSHSQIMHWRHYWLQYAAMCEMRRCFK